MPTDPVLVYYLLVPCISQYVNTDGTFEEGQVCILDSRDQVLRRKTMRLVRVLWRHYGVKESTWEREDTMRATYPFLFRDESTWFSQIYMHGIVHVAYACECFDCPKFQDEILFKEGRM